MQSIQEIFQRTLELKKKQKDLRSAYKEALAGSLEYQELVEKMKTMKEKKKQIETTTKEQFSSEFTKLEDMAIDLASDMEMMTDMALSMMMKGETVSVKDQYDNEYEPVFKVSFKKSN